MHAYHILKWQDKRDPIQGSVTWISYTHRGYLLNETWLYCNFDWFSYSTENVRGVKWYGYCNNKITWTSLRNLLFLFEDQLVIFRRLKIAKLIFLFECVQLNRTFQACHLLTAETTTMSFWLVWLNLLRLLFKVFSIFFFYINILLRT